MDDLAIQVIILEATGDMQYVLPLMLTLMAARWVGNVFNEGLYDMQIHLSKVTMLAHRSRWGPGEVLHLPVLVVHPRGCAGSLKGW